MEYRTLGDTGLKVSPACLGTATFGWLPGNFGCTQEEALPVMERAYELGINFWDTANSYARGKTEEILSEFLTPEKRKHIILATKCYGVMSDEDPNMRGNSRRNIIEACEASLKRLKTDWIDLYQLHRPQPEIPIDESIRALDDLVRSGKVRYTGTSNFGAWQLCEAHYVAKELKASSFSTEQPGYNLLDRRIERELLPFCRTYGYGVIPWSPLAGGQLTGKYLEGNPKSGRYNDDNFFATSTRTAQPEIIRKLKEIAEQNNMSLTEMSQAWVASQPGITCPIIGAKTVKQLEENVKACQIKLSEAIFKKIDEVVPPGSYFANFYVADFGPGKRPNI